MTQSTGADSRPAEDRPQGAPAGLSRRASARETSLGRQAVAWLAELPANVRPGELPIRFPHVANRLAAVWYERDRCADYFDSLMRDRRGGRRGFPPRAAFELTVLKRHHEAMVRRPQRYDWNDTIVR